MTKRPAVKNPLRNAASRRPRKREEGVAMLVVMLVLLMTTGTAIFAIHSTSSEIRSAGHSRLALQTQYVAQSGVIGGFALVDQFGPAAVLTAMRGSTPPTLEPFEPNLVAGKFGYRASSDDFSTLGVMPVSHESLGGARQAYTPSFTVDINDPYTYTGVIAGHRADGASPLKFLHASYTVRGRTNLTVADYISGAAGDRPYHQGASDARAYGISGPFSP